MDCAYTFTYVWFWSFIRYDFAKMSHLTVATCQDVSSFGRGTYMDCAVHFHIWMVLVFYMTGFWSFAAKMFRSITDVRAVLSLKSIHDSIELIQWWVLFYVETDSTVVY